MNDGVLVRLFHPEPKSLSPTDDFWYSQYPWMFDGATVSGMRVTPETAMRMSVIWRCVTLISGTIAMLPLGMYRNRDGGGRERATSMPLDWILGDTPNRWQDSFQWREMLQGHLLLRGNAYCRINAGPRGPIAELVPQHPDKVDVQKLPDGDPVYIIRQDNGRTERFLADEIFHVKGFGGDGLKGQSVISLMRESVGLGLAAQESQARIFSQGTRVSGLLKTQGKLDEVSAKANKDRWQEANAGVRNTGTVAVLDAGLEWQQIGMTNDDLQFVQQLEAYRTDFATWFGIPPHLVGDTQKSTSWGTGIEQQNIGLVTWTFLQWLARWEQAIKRQLVIASGTYYPKFNVGALLRGDMKTRADVYAIMRQWGIQNADEIRELEDWNPIGGPAGKDYLNPLNFAPAQGSPRQASNSRARRLARELASDLVGKEIGVVRKAATKYADDADGWTAWLGDFYGRHAEELARRLRVDDERAAAHAEEHRRQIAAEGVGLLERAEAEWVSQLAALALEG